MTKPASSLRPLTELLIASAFWGFGFPATIWALQTLSFPAISLYRFAGAFVVGFLLLLAGRVKWKDLRHELELSRGLGFWLATTLILQTWGMLTTSASKSAFLTVLYVIFVPLLAAVLDREKLSVRNTFCIVLALIGTAGIVNIHDFSLNLGDALTIGNAIAAAFHIRLMGKVAPRSRNPFALNVMQCFWTAVFTLPFAALQLTHPHFFHGGWDIFAMDAKGLLGLLSLTLGSSLFAFFLQVRAQGHLSASVAALLFLMESPFAAVFAALLLGERMSSLQIAGAVLIFSACLAASLPKKMAPGAHP